MKLFRCIDENSNILLAAEQDGVFVDIEKTAALKGISVPDTMYGIISDNEMAKQTLCDLLNGKVCAINGNFKYLPPLELCGKILCVGLNYYDHRKECNEFQKAPNEPVLFSKFNNAAAAHNESIPLPPVASEYDYEAELVIVISGTAKNVSVEEAGKHIFGYTIGNDLSARDLQFRTGQWLIGKSLDKFAPIGPWIVPADEIDAHNLNISCRLNGELRQAANTSQMIFTPEQIVSYASTIMTLKAGDVIFTGTPSGVILGDTNPDKQWLKAGDVTEITIEGIGTLRNKFI